MFKKVFFVLALVICAGITFYGCTDAQWGQYTSLGNSFDVKLYGCDGVIIAEYTSSGKVSEEQGSDGWFFIDAKTGKFIRLAGTVIVTER